MIIPKTIKLPRKKKKALKKACKKQMSNVRQILIFVNDDPLNYSIYKKHGKK